MVAIGYATHTVTMHTGTSQEDEWGDLGEAMTVLARDVPVSVRERNQVVNKLDTFTPRATPMCEGRVLLPGIQPTRGDIWADQDSQLQWVVDEVSTPSHPVISFGTTVKLRQVLDLNPVVTTR